MLNPVRHFMAGVPAAAATSMENCNVGDIKLLYNDSEDNVSDTKNAFARFGQKVTAGTSGKWKFTPVFSRQMLVDAWRDSSMAGSEPMTDSFKINNVDQVIPYLVRSADPVKHKMSVECNGASTDAGTSVIVRLLFKGVRDKSPNYFTQTFWATFGARVAGRLVDSTTSLVLALAALINRDPMVGKKVTASTDVSTGHAILTVESKIIDYDANQLFDWEPIIFNMTVSLAKSRSTMPASNIPPMVLDETPYGTPGTTVNGTLGQGYGPIVNQREKEALAYQGIINWTAFPVQTPPIFSNPASKYNCIDFPFSQTYTAADTTAGKHTNQSICVYFTGDLADATSANAAHALCMNFKKVFGTAGYNAIRNDSVEVERQPMTRKMSKE